jgi:hypothetical protein
VAALNHAPPALAQDALPISLKGDNMPSEFLNGLLSTMAPRGGGYNDIVNGNNGTDKRRTSRDQYPSPQPPPTTSNTAPGSFTANIDQEETNGTPPPDCDLLMHFVEICLNKLSGEERDKFVGALHSLLSGGMDQVLAPPPKAPKPNPNGSNTTLDRGMVGRRGNASDRRPAQDAAIRNTVATVNRNYGFFQRFPEAKNIKFSANGRY